MGQPQECQQFFRREVLIGQKLIFMRKNNTILWYLSKKQ